MAGDGFLVGDIAAARTRRVELIARCAFVLLLAATPLLPMMESSLFDYPAVTNWWVCLPLCALFLLALADLRHPLRLYNLDLLVLASCIVALGCYGSSRTLPLQLAYPPLVYLTVRMLCLARVGRKSSVRAIESRVVRSSLPWQWLLLGVVVLSAVHVHWALADPSTSDVGAAGAWGASRIVHGEPLYGADRALSAKLERDPHYDTYGPFDYEAYVPFLLASSSSLAARLTSLFFCLLTAGLLFVLGRRLRGPPTGLALAFAWLAYPFTLYSDGFDFNDALVAATLVGVLLVAGSPARRGAAAALAGWTKLSPLALVPLMLAHPPSTGESRPSAARRFGVGFLVASAVIFLPALAHSSLGTFVSRSFGYQAEREAAYSIWALFSEGSHYASWIVSASKVAHGLLVALTAGLALALVRLPRRQDLIGLAATSSAVLVALQICDGYYSFSYLLWFLPLVLVALNCDSGLPAGGAPEPLDLREEGRSVERAAFSLA